MQGIDLESAKQMVGPGWAGLLGVLYAAMPEGVTVTTVKEKFGGLRVYYDGGTDEFYRLSEHQEGASVHVCEQCGKAGQLQSVGGWITTLCGEHFRDRMAKAGGPEPGATDSTPGQP